MNKFLEKMKTNCIYSIELAAKAFLMLCRLMFIINL